MKNFSIIFTFLVVFFSFIKIESQEIDIDDVLDLNKIVDPRQDIQQAEKNKLDNIMFDKVDLGEYIL